VLDKGGAMNNILYNWSKGIHLLALLSLTLVVLFVPKDNMALFLVWMQIPVYYLHELEEYHLPGGWDTLMNKTVTGRETPIMPFIAKSSFVINVGLIWILFPIATLLATFVDIRFGLYPVFFSLIAVFPHFGIFMRKGYNPGVLTSLLLNLPTTIGALYYLNTENYINKIDNLWGFLFAFAVSAIFLGGTFVIANIKEKR
jgi:hypothetical protein